MANRLRTRVAEFRRQHFSGVLEDYNTTWLGFGALAAVVLVVAGLLSLKLLALGYSRYSADFAQAAALRPGNAVTVAGIEVGQVTGLKLAGDRVAVTFSVRNNVPLGRDTRAAIKVMTILGSRYLELLPDGPGSLPHKTIPLRQTMVPYDLQELLNDAGKTFAKDKVDSDQFAESLSVLGKQLGGLPALVPQAMTNLHTLSLITADRRDQLGTLLDSTQKVTDTLRRQQTDLGRLVDQGQDLLGQVVARDATVRAMLAGLTRLVNNLDRVVVNDRGSIDEMMATLGQLSGMLSQHDDLLADILQATPITLRGMSNATGYGPALEFFPNNGLAVDSWMCAISGRAKQFNMIEYFKDCK